MPVADTTFLVDVLAERPAALAKLDELLRREAAVFITAPSLHELYYGASLHRAPARERARVEELEASMPVLALDAPAARLAGTLEASLTRAGLKPGRVDVEIAATALRQGDSVITRDAAFSRVRGLAVERY